MALLRSVGVIALGICAAGCAGKSSATPGLPDVSRSIEVRTGHGLRLDGQSDMPADIKIEDGVTEEEAVAAALWNHAAFQADLALLGFSRADVIEAGLLKNPVMSLLFPVGPKQMEATFTWPLQTLWERPHRLAAARLDAARVAEDLVRHGLDLARDTRLAHGAAVLARDRLDLALEQVKIRRRIEEITQAQLKSGDISELELQPARNELSLAEEEVKRFENELSVALQRLYFFMGMNLQGSRSEALESTAARREVPALAELLKQAFASRPEVRAAELSIDTAGERARWQRSRVLALTSMLDINSQGKKGFEAGPGIQPELPVFDRNTAGRARAAAELEQSSRRYVAIRQQIGAEVEEAYSRYQEALRALRQWRESILPPLEETTRRAERAYAAGGVAYLFVMDTTRPVLQARFRFAELRSELRRARAELERSVGNRIGVP